MTIDVHQSLPFSRTRVVRNAKMSPAGAAKQAKLDSAPVTTDKMDTYLVTGGAGFIGYHVCDYILKTHSNVKVVCVDRMDYCSKKPEFTADRFVFEQAEITNPEEMLRILRDYKVDAVLHLAAQTHVDNSFGNSFTFTSSNVFGTHVLLETCKVLHPQVKRFLHISTDEVYGENLGGPGHVFTEGDTLEPTNPYSATKAAAEHIVKTYYRSYGIPILIARPNNVYGPRQFPEKVIPKFTRQLMAGKALTVHGAGQSRRSFLYCTDIAEALVDFCLLRGKIGETYNVGSSNKAVTVVELAEEMMDIFHVPEAKRNRVFVEDRAYNDQRYDISSEKLHALGWRPRVSWREGLELTVKWYQDHPAGYWSNEAQAIVAHPRMTGGDKALEEMAKFG
jgi:UDP-glucose 4,6-dehydratase